MVVICKLLWCREAEGEPAQGLLLLKDVNVLQFLVGFFFACHLLCENVGMERVSLGLIWLDPSVLCGLTQSGTGLV